LTEDKLKRAPAFIGKAMIMSDNDQGGLMMLL
jgi:hypothetical protein